MRLPTITPTKLPYRQVLRSTTLRDFSGGWNVRDDDMNLNPRFATKLTNCYPTPDGRIAVRKGVSKFARIFDTPITNMYYFSDSLVVVSLDGGIYRVLGDGTVVTLSTTFWNDTEFVSFAEFNGHLILCNGIDKPLDIDSDFNVELLQDAATNTNINVPICKYVIAINRYLVMGGDPLEPGRVHVSARDAAGTWFGDPEPNDATRIDVGSVLNATTIRGLLLFRGKLVVMFAEGLVFGTLGTTDDAGNHTPSFDDGVEGYGSFSHRAGLAYGDDAFFMDLEGIPSIRRTVLSTSFKPERPSYLIDPEVRASLNNLTFATLEDRTFGIHNKKDNQFLLFVPDSNDRNTTTETRVFVYNRIADNVESWCEYRGWNFTCGARSAQGNMFFGDNDGHIWLYDGDKDYADYKSVPANPGQGIEFDWEMPWLDFGNRAITKQTKYISFDTRGASEFDCRMYVDNFDDYALFSEFSAGEQGHFGDGPQPYGGGRNTSRKKLFAWPCKFEIAKLRVSGTASEGLSFVSITLHYMTGSINR